MELALATAQGSAQVMFKLLEFANFQTDLAELVLQTTANSGASANVSAAQSKQVANLRKGESEALRSTNEAYGSDVFACVDAEASRGARDRGENIGAFVKTDGVYAYARLVCYLTDVQVRLLESQLYTLEHSPESRAKWNKPE